MARKTHTHENVTYSSGGRKWNFTATAANGGTYVLNTMDIRGGAETAHKVARVINGAVKRTGKGEIDKTWAGRTSRRFSTRLPPPFLVNVFCRRRRCFSVSSLAIKPHS